MTMKGSLTGARLVTVAGLVAGAAGILIQRASGVAMPAVPPGLVLLLAAALLIAFTRLRWAAALGALIAVPEIAAITIGQLDAMADAGALGVFLGTWVRAVGVVAALVAGVAATVSAYRVRGAAR